MGGSSKFFRVPEEEADASAVERVQEGPKRCQPDQVRTLALNLISRGIDVDKLTVGEIIYLCKTTQERDQILWACSAQSSELLPKPKRKIHKEAWSQSVRKHFEGVDLKMTKEQQTD